MNCFFLILTLLAQHYQINNSKAKQIAYQTCTFSKKFKIDPLYAISIMKIETNFTNYKKPNKSLDYGIMQLHCPYKTWAKWCKNIRKLKNLDYNIQQGIYFLSHIKNKCKSPMHHWIKHYNYNSKKHNKRVLKFYNKTKNIIKFMKFDHKSIKYILRSSINYAYVQNQSP